MNWLPFCSRAPSSATPGTASQARPRPGSKARRPASSVSGSMPTKSFSRWPVIAMRWIGQSRKSAPATNAGPRASPMPRASAYRLHPDSAMPRSAVPLNAAAAPHGQKGSASTPFSGPTPSTSTEMPCGQSRCVVSGQLTRPASACAVYQSIQMAWRSS